MLKDNQQDVSQQNDNLHNDAQHNATFKNATLCMRTFNIMSVSKITPCIIIHSLMPLLKMPLNIKTFSRMSVSKMTLSIITLNLTKHSIVGNSMARQHNDPHDNDILHK